MQTMNEIMNEINNLSQWVMDVSEQLATLKSNSENSAEIAKIIEKTIANEFKEDGVTKANIIAASHEKVIKSLEDARPIRLEYLKLSTKHQAAIIRLDCLKSILMAELAVLKHTAPFK